MRPGRLSRGRQLPQPIYKRRSLYLGRRAKREYIVRVLTPAEAEAQRRPSPDVWQEWQKVLRDGDELIEFEPAYCHGRIEALVAGVALLRNGRTLRVEIERYYITQRSIADSEAPLRRRRPKTKAVRKASPRPPAQRRANNDGLPGQRLTRAERNDSTAGATH
jgi:hypothetical protein